LWLGSDTPTSVRSLAGQTTAVRCTGTGEEESDAKENEM